MGNLSSNDFSVFLSGIYITNVGMYLKATTKVTTITTIVVVVIKFEKLFFLLFHLHPFEFKNKKISVLKIYQEGKK